MGEGIYDLVRERDVTAYVGRSTEGTAWELYLLDAATRLFAYPRMFTTRKHAMAYLLMCADKHG